MITSPNYYLMLARSRRAQMRSHALEARAAKLSPFNSPSEKSENVRFYLGIAVKYRDMAIENEREALR